MVGTPDDHEGGHTESTTASTKTATKSEPNIAVALSGGGHRAALWGAGVLLALVDAGVNADVTTISSVSGGSIANGAVAAHVDFQQVGETELEHVLRPAIRQWATGGLFFTGPPTDRYVGSVFNAAITFVAVVISFVLGLVALGQHWSFIAVAATAAALCLVASGVALFLPTGALARYQTELVAGAVVVGPAAIASLLAATHAHTWYSQIAFVLVGGAVVGLLGHRAVARFGRRSVELDDALATGLLARNENGTTVVQPLPTTVGPAATHHVFCSTDLQTGNHAYLSRSWVYSDGIGLRTPAESFRLSTAVQASACLPGAFAPRTIPDASFEPLSPGVAHNANAEDAGSPDSRLVLSDGGVYDNMADQWTFGEDQRHRRLTTAGVDVSPLPPRADVLIVANAGGSMDERTMASTRGLAGEVRALLRNKDTLYDVTTAVRRRYLIEMFRLAERSGSGLQGNLVQITQDPRAVVRAAMNSDAEATRGRAVEAHAVLSAIEAADPAAEPWDEVARTNRSIPTTLGPIGAVESARLLQHAYVLTRINTYMWTGQGRLPDPHDTRQIGACLRVRFDDLVGVPDP